MKKVISLFLSVVILLSITAGLDFSAYATVYTGSCGNGSVAYTFDDESGLLTISGKGEMVSYTSFHNAITFDKVVAVKIGTAVTSISSCAFSRHHSSAVSNYYTGMSMTSAIIGSGVKSIGSSAFRRCTKLSEIVIPNGCSIISDFVFQDCSSLETVQLGNGVKTLGRSAFEWDSKLTNINFPDNLEEIGYRCFYGCRSLSGDIVLSNKLSSIGTDAFYGCSSITSITILNPDCAISQSNVTIPLNITIKGHVGSTAQEYAEVYGNEFVPISTETIEIISPTCTEQGYTLHTCDDCGRTFKTDFTDALGHREVYQAEQSPTCVENGFHDGYVCSVCGETTSGMEVISATGHQEIVTKNGKEPTCILSGLTEEKNVFCV